MKKREKNNDNENHKQSFRRFFLPGIGILAIFLIYRLYKCNTGLSKFNDLAEKALDEIDNEIGNCPVDIPECDLSDKLSKLKQELNALRTSL